MGNITKLLESGANISVSISTADLLEFFRAIQNKWHEEQTQFKAAHTADKELLSINAVVTRLSVSKPTLWRWDKQGYLHPVKVGRRNFYRLSDVNKIMEGSAI